MRSHISLVQENEQLFTKNFVALAAALSQCKEGFKDEVIHIYTQVFFRVNFTQFYKRARNGNDSIL